MAKIIVVVGGVYSGGGKGITAASVAFLLRLRGEKVQLIKCDPYLNRNAGTMNPKQHGEVFLCNDGSETDLDLGHYERITGIEMSRRNIFTSGVIYEEIGQKEERGDYLGETVQMIPHVTDLIQKKITSLAEDGIVIAEIGGTVGDYESEALYSAARQLKQANPNDVMILMVAPIIYNNTVKEFKTKPLQNAITTLMSKGMAPDILMCRVDRECPPQILDKISRMTGIKRDAIFDAPDVKSIYEVPIEFYKRSVDRFIAEKFKLDRNPCKIKKYEELVEDYLNGHDWPTVNIGIVGKYENCDEAYHSLKEAITHAAVANNTKFVIRWIKAEELETAKDARALWRHFQDLHGIIVPGGFDIRGVEGKIMAIKYVRDKKIPFLGICLGLQCAVIEFARNELHEDQATSEEFEKDSEYKVIHYVQGQETITKKSGTMRLGAYDCELVADSIVSKLYKKKIISERHRHRYEVNPEYLERYAKKGLIVTGRNPQSGLVEMMELDQKLHPFFVGTQAHPEFKSRLGEPSPLFDGLIKAALQKKIQAEQETKP